MPSKIDKIVIENAEIFFKNFSGKPSQFNAQGDRNFCVFVNDMADKLAADGWNVKARQPKEEGDEVRYFLKVAVKYGDYPPKIFMVSKKNKILLDESSVGMLDNAYIENVDLIISPYVWTVGGKSGVKAYVDTMYVTIQEDPFAMKYADVGNGLNDDDLPF